MRTRTCSRAAQSYPLTANDCSPRISTSPTRASLRRRSARPFRRCRERSTAAPHPPRSLKIGCAVGPGGSVNTRSTLWMARCERRACSPIRSSRLIRSRTCLSSKRSLFATPRRRPNRLPASTSAGASNRKSSTRSRRGRRRGILKGCSAKSPFPARRYSTSAPTAKHLATLPASFA